MSKQPREPKLKHHRNNAMLFFWVFFFLLEGMYAFIFSYFLALEFLTFISKDSKSLTENREIDLITSDACNRQRNNNNKKVGKLAYFLFVLFLEA